MRRGARVLLVVAGAAVLAVAAAVLSLAVFLRGEGVRARVEATLTHAVGRPVTIEGLDLSLLTGSAVAHGVRVADDPRFGPEPFVQAARVELGLQLRPLLLRREVRIDSVTLREPSIRLVRDDAGMWNYATLRRAADPKRDAPRSYPAPQVSSLAIEDGAVRVLLPPSGNGTAGDRVYNGVSLRVHDFALDRAFPFQFAVSLPGGGNVTADGDAGPWAVEHAVDTPVRAHVRATHLDLAAAGLVSAASGVSGLLDQLAFDVHWGKDSLRVTDLQVVGPYLAIDRTRATSVIAQAKPSAWGAVAQRLSIAPATVRLDTVTAVRGDGARSVYRHVEIRMKSWSQDAWTSFDASAGVGGGAVRANGRMLIPGRRGDLPGAAAQLETRLALTQVNLAQSGWLAPTSGVTGIVDAAVDVHWANESMHALGKARIARLKLAKAGQPAEKPLELIFDMTQTRRDEEVEGSIAHAAGSVGTATVQLSGGYRSGASGAVLNLHASGDRLPIDEIEAFLPAFGVQLPAGSRLTGGTVTTSLTLSGTASQPVIDGLVRVENTRLMGFNLGAKLASLAKFTGGRLGSSGDAGTTIRSLAFDLHRANGLTTTDKIIGNIGGLGTVTGAGNVGEGATLHYALSLRLEELTAGSGGGSALARSVASALPGPWAAKAMSAIDALAKGAMSRGIPILIGGTAQHPVISPNLGAMLPPETPRSQTRQAWPLHDKP